MSKPVNLTAALAYGKAGLFVFPILEGTKDQPLIKQWGVRASKRCRADHRMVDPLAGSEHRPCMYEVRDRRGR